MINDEPAEVLAAILRGDIEQADAEVIEPAPRLPAPNPAQGRSSTTPPPDPAALFADALRHCASYAPAGDGGWHTLNPPY